jgi:hypothetical protein
MLMTCPDCAKDAAALWDWIMTGKPPPPQPACDGIHDNDKESEDDE